MDRARVLALGALPGIVAGVPVIPHIVDVLHGAPRFTVFGDYATLETATRFALSGRTLLGPYSRFEFNHPGPLYFMVTVPVQRIFGDRPLSLFLAACFVNAMAAFAIPSMVRVALGARQAWITALVVLAWMAAFGNVSAIPWNPNVAVMPLTAFAVCAALVASGAVRVAAVGLVFGALAATAHVGFVPLVALFSVLAAVSAVRVRRRRGERIDHGEKRALALSALVFAVAALPPLFEQIWRDGNMTKLARFFATKHPHQSLASAFAEWANTTSWLPDRLINVTLLHEMSPQPQLSEAMPTTLSATDARFAAVWALMTALGIAAAWRRRAWPPLAMLVLGLVGAVASVFLLRGVVGEVMCYLVFWTTVPTTIAWLGAALLVGDALASRLSARSLRPFATVLVGVSLLWTTWLQRSWTIRRELIARTAQPGARTVYDTLRRRLEMRGVAPIVHIDGAWHISAMLVDELSRDGVDVRILPRERWLLGAYFSPPDAGAPAVHVYTADAATRLPCVRCLQLIADVSGIRVFTAETELADCPR